MSTRPRRATLAALFLAQALLVASAGAADPPPAVPEEAPALEPEPRFGFGLLPIVNYSSDFGLGVGAAGSIFHFADGLKPYHWDVDGAAYASTRGMRLFAVLGDLPSVAGSAFRLNVMALYSRNLGAPFYGIGNAGHATPSRGELYNFYDLEDPTLRVYLRRPLWGPLLAYAGLRFSADVVRVRPASLLAELAPYGLEGGPYNQLNAGFLWDTRDNEPSPAEGLLLEATGRVAARWLLSAYSTRSLFLSASGYHSLHPRVVLAGRLAFDRQWGNVPFTHLDDFGGLFAGSGLGGSQTIRGLLQSQLVGKVKALANLETRVRLTTWTIFRRTLELDGAVFVDAGRVWADEGPDGPFPGLHGSVGGGVRAIWDSVFVVRADVGRSADSTRIYIDVWQPF